MGFEPTEPSLAKDGSSRNLLNFGLWLRKRGNRDSTVIRKLKFLKGLSGSVDNMVETVLKCGWVDKSKAMALLVVQQYAEFMGLPVPKVNYKTYDNREVYVPNPQMIKQLVYRIRNVGLRGAVLLAVETGSCSSEVLGLTWRDVNLVTKTVTVKGVKGHRTISYPVSNELATLLSLIPRVGEKVFVQKTVNGLNDSLKDYVQRLARETGNTDYLKIHFHTLRHYAISWKYFKTKDIVETQRFARHCNIQNTLKYVHIVRSWIKENEYNVVYAQLKEELEKYLTEGFTLVTKTECGYVLTKPKTLFED